MKKEITIRKMINFFSLVLLISFTSCNDDWEPTIDPIESGDLVVKTSQVINESYIGNGAQWDPYPQAYRYWGTPISDADWNKLYTRLDYMKPSFMRVVIGSYDKYALAGADEYNPEDLFEGLNKILQYCQDNNITVMLGDWGYNQVDINSEMIFENRLKNAARYIDFLVREKGFTCIKHYSTINEPNLGGSATDGNYELWKNATQYFYQELEALGVTGKVGIAGPDIAPFTRDITSWITDTTNDFGDKISLYDIHTYPPREWMFNGDYDEFLKIYKDATPAGSQIVIGEFGFKYETSTSTMDTELFRQNLSAINSDPNVARDSNTLIDEFFHGVDIAAATMKIVNAGYSGAATWNLDDAMHSGSTSGQDLKIWGFWNILGQELLGKPEKEELRPHFYSYSLLTRYMQTGAKVFTVDIPNRIGLDAIAVEKDGKYMIAINNIYTEEHSLNIKFDNKLQLFEAKKFIYRENDRKVDDNGFPVPTEEGLTLDFGAGEDIIIPAQTLTVITNFDY
ncbi:MULTISPECIES: cellulase family glycosylhydrolase [Aquimarina]|uniref:cellulase family glycosylhydrolase n=1 Tax=Aquimarina TaxID=290174 RepID=UPI000D69E18D|nr:MULTISPECIES: cellulase family glycosylhydrolase [Aquimarina]